MNKYTKDPLLWISILLAMAGGVQANTGYLSDLATKHPTAFGLTMTGISILTGALTALKSFIMVKAPPNAPTGLTVQ